MPTGASGRRGWHLDPEPNYQQTMFGIDPLAERFHSLFTPEPLLNNTPTARPCGNTAPMQTFDQLGGVGRKLNHRGDVARRAAEMGMRMQEGRGL